MHIKLFDEHNGNELGFIDLWNDVLPRKGDYIDDLKNHRLLFVTKVIFLTLDDNDPKTFNRFGARVNIEVQVL